MKKILLSILFLSLLLVVDVEAGHHRKKTRERSVNFSFNVNYGPSVVRRPIVQSYYPVAYQTPTVIVLNDRRPRPFGFYDSYCYDSYYYAPMPMPVRREQIIILR